MTKNQFIKRLKSLGWRVGMVVVAYLVSYGLDNLSSFNLSPEVTVLLGLVLGEVSKQLNTSSQK